MKKILLSSLVMLAGFSAHAGKVLKPVEDATVPVAVIDDFKAASIGEKKNEIDLTVRLTMAYIGTAAGYDSVMLNILDSGPAEGDYGNSTVFSLGRIVGSISNLKLRKSPVSKQFILSYKATSLEMSDAGDFEEVDASKVLKISLSKEGTLLSVEQLN